MAEVPFEVRGVIVDVEKYAVTGCAVGPLERRVEGVGGLKAVGGSGRIVGCILLEEPAAGVKGGEGRLDGEAPFGPLPHLPAACPECLGVVVELLDAEAHGRAPDVVGVRIEGPCRVRQRIARGVVVGGRLGRPQEGLEPCLPQLIRLLVQDPARPGLRFRMGLAGADLAGGDGVEELAETLEGVRVEVLVGRGGNVPFLHAGKTAQGALRSSSRT